MEEQVRENEDLTKNTKAEENEFKKMDLEFIRSLRYHLLSRSNAIHSMHRALGKKYDENLPTYIDFMSVSGGNVLESKVNEYFLVASIFYAFESVYDESDYHAKTYIPFEVLLGRLYDKTDSTNTDIKNLLRQKRTDKNAFLKQMSLFVIRCKNEIYGNETLDYLKLLNDLKFWDEKTRYRWADTILSYGRRKKSEKEEF